MASYTTDDIIQHIGNKKKERHTVTMGAGDTVNTTVAIATKRLHRIESVEGAPNYTISSDKKTATVNGFDASYVSDVNLVGL